MDAKFTSWSHHGDFDTFSTSVEIFKMCSNFQHGFHAMKFPTWFSTHVEFFNTVLKTFAIQF